jgi:tricorn protease
MSQLYYQSPTTNGESLVFTCDNDLWKVAIKGGEARRLTNSLSSVSGARFSPDGKQIAFLASEEGNLEVYVMDARGGEYRRVTYEGMVRNFRWKNNQELYIFTTAEFHHLGETRMVSLNLKTLERTLCPWGAVTDFVEDDDVKVIGRYCRDAAIWKRYKGGTAGAFWVKRGTNKYKRILKSITSSIGNPELYKKRLYFLSDHEGHSNLYSCNLSGSNIKRHTDFDHFYIRKFKLHKNLATFQAGGEIYTFDLETEELSLISIDVFTSAVEFRTRYIDADECFSEIVADHTGEMLSVIARGQLFSLHPWLGGYSHHGTPSAVRYGIPQWKDDRYLFCVATNEERVDEIQLIDTEKNRITHRWAKSSTGSWGKIWSLSISPDGNFLAVANNRCELFLINTKDKKVKLIDISDRGRIRHLNWSPYERYLSYTKAIDYERVQVTVYDQKTKKTQGLIEPLHNDWGAVFSDCGKYLYFLGIREFETTMSNAWVNLQFDAKIKPYVVSLQAGLESPYDRSLYDFEEEDDDDDDDKKNKKKKEDIAIDYNGINNRILPFPIKHGNYTNLQVKEGKLFFLKGEGQEFILWSDYMDPEKTKLCSYSFSEDKVETFASKIADYQLTDEGDKVLLIQKDEVRLVGTDSKPKDDTSKFNKHEGHINLEKLKIEVNPAKEWRQMYDEAWVLQREHFWNPKLGGIDWEGVYLKYLPVLDKIRTRDEMSDLIWEMQGELGTSHCYEMGGERPFESFDYKRGFLGGSFRFHKKTKSFEITELSQGETWNKQTGNPLMKLGVELSVGDHIYALDGRRFKNSTDLDRYLVNKADEVIDLIIKRKGKSKEEVVAVTTLKSPYPLLYRNWVNKNRDYVHKKTKGRVGYVHVPNMGFEGFQEFYRHYLVECKKDAVIIDVRYNGGGFVSQFLLRELAQKMIGVDFTRHEQFAHYPFYSVNGPMIALTNELAGSDGDIFSHSFKLFGLGKLVGKRTWGGVIGINGQYDLVDGSFVSQPEYSFWFKDVGFAVENYGTDPDIEVEITPDDYAAGADPQLDRCIAEMTKEIKRFKKIPTIPTNMPKLKAPKLPRSRG